MTYGCYNRADYVPTVTMQDGWQDGAHSVEYVPGGAATFKRSPTHRVLTAMPFRMSPRCEYTATSELGQADAKCIGCSRRAPALDAPQ